MTDEDVAANHGCAHTETGSARSPRTTRRPGAHAAVWRSGPRPGLRAVPTLLGNTPINDERHLALWQAIERTSRQGIAIDGLVALGLPEFSARSSANRPRSQWRAKGWVEEAGKKGLAMAFRTAPRKPIQDEAGASTVAEEDAACSASR